MIITPPYHKAFKWVLVWHALYVFVLSHSLSAVGDSLLGHCPNYDTEWDSCKTMMDVNYCANIFIYKLME